MYVGVDIGGTKTLVAALDDNGVIKDKVRFETPRDYPEFIAALQKATSKLPESDFRAGCIAAPGKIDHDRGIVTYFGTLPWQNVPLEADGLKTFGCPILIENDAKLAGLSESKLLPPDKRILYVTISTGIGTGFICNQHIDPGLEDIEGGQMLLDYRGKREAWEDFASGSAIVRRFGKKAEDIDDEPTWQRIAHDLAQGFIELIAITQPEIIVVGGSVGKHLDRFKTYLLHEIEHYNNPLLAKPEFLTAQRPDDAVLYGCFDLAKEHYGSNS
jgi:predicted NBD/HSP70 family sugar kinase